MSRLPLERERPFFKAVASGQEISQEITRAIGETRISAVITGIGLGIAVGSRIISPDSSLMLNGAVAAGTGASLLKLWMDRLRLLHFAKDSVTARLTATSPVTIARRRRERWGIRPCTPVTKEQLAQAGY